MKCAESVVDMNPVGEKSRIQILRYPMRSRHVKTHLLLTSLTRTITFRHVF